MANQDPNILSPAMMRAIHAAGRQAGLDHDALHDAMRQRWPAKASLRELTTDEAWTFLRGLSNQKCEIGNQKSRVRPRGRTRDPEITPLATPKQRRFLRELLERLSGPEAAYGFVCMVLGGVNKIDLGATWDQVVAIPTTMTEARKAINRAIGELKRRGMWTDSGSELMAHSS